MIWVFKSRQTRVRFLIFSYVIILICSLQSPYQSQTGYSIMHSVSSWLATKAILFDLARPQQLCGSVFIGFLSLVTGISLSTVKPIFETWPLPCLSSGSHAHGHPPPARTVGGANKFCLFGSSVPLTVPANSNEELYLSPSRWEGPSLNA